ncbi:hypothetical protein B0H10DRAFT_2026540, partial [Mycena sp. CBHHK59/15]
MLRRRATQLRPPSLRHLPRISVSVHYSPMPDRRTCLSAPPLSPTAHVTSSIPLPRPYPSLVAIHTRRPFGSALTLPPLFCSRVLAKYP